MLITRSTITASNEAFQGYYMMSFGQNALVGTKTWTKKSIFDLISDIGGLGISIAAFLQFCLSKRTEYCYDVSRMKRFFYFAK